MKKSLTILALLLSLSFQLVAQKTWTGATSTAWNLAGNWSPSGVPIATDNVTIPSGTTNSPTVSGSTGGVCNNLTVNSGAILSISATSGSSTTLTVGGTATFNGALSIGGFMGNTGKLAAGNVVWNSSSSINAYFGGRMEVSGNYTFASGSSINLGLCWLTFTGGSNSHIYNHSAASSFGSVTLSKTGSAVVYVNSSSTATMTIDGTLNIGAGSVFIGQPNITTILKGNLINSGNIYLNSGTLSLEKSSGTQDIQINTNDYFNSVRINTGGTVTISTSYFMQLKGSMNIQAGVLDPQNNTIALFGDWTNTVGTGGFEQGIGRVIFNGGNYHQYCSNETFFTLEVHKTVGGALRVNGTNVICTKYDWTAGAIDVLNNGTFTVSNQLLDNGIAGNFYLNAGCTINLTNLTGNVDLKGNLYIYGGNFNVYGGVNPSWWPSGGNASITMSGGVLDFVDQSIVVKTDPTYTFTQNITGGTIRTAKNFTNGRTDFTPTGGAIELYGPIESSLLMTTGNLFSLKIDKTSGTTVNLDGNATINGGLTINSGTLRANNKILTTGDVIVINNGGTLWMDLNSQLKISASKYLNVFSGGTFRVVGTLGNEPVITRNGSSGYYVINISSGGTIAAKHASFYYADPLRVYSDATIEEANPFSYCTFRYAQFGMLRIDNSQNLVIRNVEFLQPAAGYNVYKSVNSGSLEFKDAYGDYSGASYENDSYNRIHWSTSQPGLWTGVASNDWNDPENWDDLALPNSTSSVVIPVAAPNMPVVNSEIAISVNNLTIQGTLTINDANLISQNNCSVGGSLAMSPGISEYGVLQVYGHLTFESGSSASLTSTSDISVQKNLAFNSGSNVQIDNGRLILNGAFISQVINHSGNTFIEKLVVDKSGSFYARFSDASTQHLYVNYLTLWDGSFLTAGDKHFILNKDLDNTGGHISCTEGTFKLDGITQTLKLLPDDYFHHLVFSQTGTASLNTVNTSVLNVNGDLHINSGVFDATGLTVKVGGNWANTVGPAAFTETGSRVIFNGGNYHQYLWHDETFDILEVDKPLGGALRMNDGPTIICNVYDWTAGAIDALNGAEFIANALAGDGIQGDYYINEGCSITLNCSSGNPDLNGNLHIFGGTFTIITPDNTESKWPGNTDASINMSGGVLDVYPKGIRINNAPMLTTDITGGVIKTTGDFYCYRSDFEPAGGALEFYGNNHELYMTNGKLYGLTINCNSNDGMVDFLRGPHVLGPLNIDRGGISLYSALYCYDEININNNGWLDMFYESAIRMDNGTTLNVNSGGKLFSILGVFFDVWPFIGTINPNDGYFNLTVHSGGTIDVTETYFRGVNPLEIMPGAIIQGDEPFWTCVFDRCSNGMLKFHDQSLTIRNIGFFDGTGYNVAKTSDIGNITIIDAVGDFAGPDYENDPYNRIDWVESQPGLWTGAVSSNWHNPDNWDDLKVPTTSTDVIIPSGLANMPEVIVEDAYCHSLTVNGTLIINGMDIRVTGLDDNSYAVINGMLVLKAIFPATATAYIYGDLTWGSGSEIDMQNAHTDIYALGNVIFCEGANVNFNNGRLILGGSTNSQIIMNSADCSLLFLVISKPVGYSAQFSGLSTQPMVVRFFSIIQGNFFSESEQEIIVLQSLINHGGVLQMNAGACILSSSMTEIKLRPDDYFNHLVFNNFYTLSFNTEHTSFLNVNGNLEINSWVFDATGLTINIGGNWNNNVGPEAFNESNSRVIFNGGDYHQYCHNETFNILEVDKSSGGLLYVNDVICQTYDWTAGGIITGVSKSFTAHDLADDGIYGSYNTGVSGTINLYQDAGSPVHLNGHLEALGSGTINVYGGNDWSNWGAVSDASVTMNGGTINFADQGILVQDNPPWQFTSNITGGTIKTSGSFRAWSPGFNPSGGTVELYGSGWVELSGNHGGYFNNLLIDKTTGSNVDISDIKVNENLTVVNGSLKLLSNKTLECPGSISLNSYLSVQRGAAIKLGNNSSFNANTGGMLHFSGSEEEKAKLTGITASDHYDIQFSSGSYLIAAQGIFENMGDQGVNFASGSEILLMTDCEFRNGKSGSTPMLTIDNAQDLLLENITFNGSSKASQFNVRKNVNEGSVFFLDANGDMAGQDFEDDTHGRIHWMPASYASDPQTVGTGVAICEDAFYMLTVADLVVESGGSADLIASQRIKILPGTHVMSGGNMHAWITETYEFCEQQESMLASVSPADEEENSFLPAMWFATSDDKYNHLKMYPNPTSGIVNIELNGLNPDEKIILQVYGITGELREQFYYSGAQTLSLDLSGWNPGVYLIRILDGNKSITGKIIKQ